MGGSGGRSSPGARAHDFRVDEDMGALHGERGGEEAVAHGVAPTPSERDARDTLTQDVGEIRSNPEITPGMLDQTEAAAYVSTHGCKRAGRSAPWLAKERLESGKIPTWITLPLGPEREAGREKLILVRTQAKIY
jgi:hypothetical protein